MGEGNQFEPFEGGVEISCLSDWLNKSVPFSHPYVGGEPTVQVRQSVLESDRAMTAVFAHEYFEMAGLYKRSHSNLRY